MTSHWKLCHRWSVVVLCLILGCEEINQTMNGPQPKPVSVTPSPPVEMPKASPAPPVDRAKIDAIEKRDAAIGVVRSFEGSLPSQRTDAMLISLSEVPDDIFTLTELDLSACHQLTDVGLPAISKMPRIESIDLSHIKFSEQSLVGLRDLPKLKKLTMLKSQIPGEPSLVAIGQLSHLEELTLSGTAVADSNFAALTGLTNLKTLHMDFTPVTDAVFEHLAKLPQLEVLTVSETNITSAGLKKLCHAESKLRVLDVHQTFAGRNGFANLDGLPLLEELDASVAAVDDKSLKGWASPPRLRILNLSENGFTNLSVQGLLKSPSLEELILQKVQGVTDQALNFIVKKTELKFVQLDQTSVTLQSAQLLKQKMPQTRVGIAGTIY